MGMFSNLFRKSSMGAPLKYQCARCGKRLHAGTGALLVGRTELLEHMSKKALQCPACGKIFCGDCSIQSDKELGRPKGATDFTCPFCRTTGIA